MEIFWKFITRITIKSNERQNFIYKWNITKILSLANQFTTVVRKSGFYLSQPEGAIVGMKKYEFR